jgi:hypothetical protein
VGEEQDQRAVLEEKQRAKEEVVAKARLSQAISKRMKYLHSWVDYHCHFSSNSLYFYQRKAELVPDSILNLRGAVISNASTATKESTHYILEISQDSETTYIEFTDGETLARWQEELNKAVNELKDKEALLLGEAKKKRRTKKEEMVSLRLGLRELSWNYLNEQGQTYMQVQLSNISLRVNEQEHKVDTVFQVEHLSIHDQVYRYQNQKYQHFLKSTNLTVTVLKLKDKATKARPVEVETSLDLLDLNWKPDALLLLINSLKEFMDVQPLLPHKDLSR